MELMRSLDQTRSGIDTAALGAACTELAAQGRARLDWYDGEVKTRVSADMRYGEQVFEISVPLDDVDITDASAIAEAFHSRHEAQFTYALRKQPVFIANVRASAIGVLPPIPARPPAKMEPAAPGARAIYLDGWVTVPLYAFAKLAVGQAIEGPAIVESDTTTILLRRGDRARLDAGGWLEVDVKLSEVAAIEIAQGSPQTKRAV
jgi:N-methylhydantoinase A